MNIKDNSNTFEVKIQKILLYQRGILKKVMGKCRNDKANTLNKNFASVFTVVNKHDMSNFELQEYITRIDYVEIKGQ